MEELRLPVILAAMGLIMLLTALGMSLYKDWKYRRRIEVPLVFRRDIYALACFVGGLIYAAALMCGMVEGMAQIACAVAVVVIRICAVTLHWQLPILKDEE